MNSTKGFGNMKTLPIVQSGNDGYSIVELIRRLDYENLKTLLPIVQAELDRKNPETIERDRRMNAFWAEQKRKNEEKEKARELSYQTLKRVLAPGMLLKMKGCKDGKGLREFIRWDGENLVCWQIVVRRSWVNGAGAMQRVNTNIVTTHMADKVSAIFGNTSNQLIPMKKILAGVVPA